MHLSTAILWVNPGNIREYYVGHVDICCQFLAWYRGLNCFLALNSRIPGKDPWFFLCT